MTRKLAALAAVLVLAGCPSFPERLCNTDQDCPGSSCNLETGVCHPLSGDEDGGADAGADAGTDGGPSCDPSCDGPCRLCFEGACVPAAAGTDHPGCDGHLCDGTTQACPTGCATDADCASTHFCAGEDCHERLPDGLACSGDAQCESEHCVAGVCCDEACTGGGPCVQASCVTGTCERTYPTGPCNDGDACTVEDACDGSGACAGRERDCDDGNDCTADSCSPLSGCAHEVRVGEDCDDGNDCTTGETCQSDGACAAGEGPDCDDGDPCTDDTCDPATGECTSTLDTSNVCSDGNQCTEGDYCALGSICEPGGLLDCDDGNPCTDDDCHPVTGLCMNVVVEGAACDDGNACTRVDQCNADGECVGGSLEDCDDGDPCTDDVCDPTTGACGNTLDPTNRCPDTDNDVCTVEACTTAGQCATTISPSCCSTGSAPNFTGNCSSGTVVWLPDNCQYDYTHFNASGSCTTTQVFCASGRWGTEFTDGGVNCGMRNADQWSDNCGNRSAKTVSCN